MSKSLSALLSLLASSLVSDETINDILEEAGFSGTPLLQVVYGYDPENPPELNETPTIYINSGGRGRTADFRMRTHVISVWPVLQLARRSDDIDFNSLDALTLIDAFANAIDNAVLNVMQTNQYVALPQPSEEADQLIFPAVRAFLGYDVQIPSNLPITYTAPEEPEEDPEGEPEEP